METGGDGLGVDWRSRVSCCEDEDECLCERHGALCWVALEDGSATPELSSFIPR